SRRKIEIKGEILEDRDKRSPLVVLAKVLLAVEVVSRPRSPVIVFWWLPPDKKEEAAGKELLRLHEELAQLQSLMATAAGRLSRIQKTQKLVRKR
ncbi:hypothetical protein CSPAE12_00562, partial [Colletotrichum incanum]